MNVAFCIFDGMTALDFVGAYDPITRLDRMGFREVGWDVCARTETVRADSLTFEVDRTEPDLGGYDMVVVPGGFATRKLVEDEAFVDWLRTAEGSRYKASVCTGALLLGAAGLLDGRRATTHPQALDALEAYAEAVEERVVRDGDVVTAGGVSSAIDLGLHVAELLTDTRTREAIAEQMDYPYGWDGQAAP